MRKLAAPLVWLDKEFSKTWTGYTMLVYIVLSNIVDVVL